MIAGFFVARHVSHDRRLAARFASLQDAARNKSEKTLTGRMDYLMRTKHGKPAIAVRRT